MKQLTHIPHVRMDLGWKVMSAEPCQHYVWQWSDKALLHALCGKLAELSLTQDKPQELHCELCQKILPFWSRNHA